MFHRIERELSDGEPWSVRQYSQLPPDIQLLVEREQGIKDIWELPSQNYNNNAPNKNKKLKRFLLYPLFSVIRNKLLKA
ncbi:hypothetical protein [Nostoc sp. 106C]|jgi:hypothetical protein|uniref:hypothetical protein n=1 Tax=Nostoc sp. 106C TaxID=1932667 RepID=UPI000A38C940|nr:hypothetical protein [Nostoc sp. 106C]OUL31876.1 hypothetical protein BV378_01005 [Nostoc sp. RF31YmG]OUL36244.1 hypothetical protein BV375_00105 [Nostoc sp. 106C]